MSIDEILDELKRRSEENPYRFLPNKYSFNRTDDYYKKEEKDAYEDVERAFRRLCSVKRVQELNLIRKSL